MSLKGLWILPHKIASKQTFCKANFLKNYCEITNYESTFLKSYKKCTYVFEVITGKLQCLGKWKVLEKNWHE